MAASRARQARPANPEDIHEICMALPEVELGTSWGGRTTYKVPAGAHGKGFLLYRAPHKSAVNPETCEMYDDLLVISVPDAAAKDALAEDPGTPFFAVPHFNGYNAVLVQQSRLDELDRDELAEIITEAWACKAPKRLVLDYFAEP